MNFLLVYIGFLISLSESRSYNTYFDNIIINIPKNIRWNFHSTTDMPPADQAARVARYVMHKSDWCSIASISTIQGIEGFPYANTYSVADGPENQSSGVPYLYLTELEMTSQDIQKDNRVTISISMAEKEYCVKKDYDPEDPRCVHVTLAGRLVRVTDSEELKFSKYALFSRHPIMATWPKSHNFYVGKIVLEKIVVMDAFGGPKFVTPKEYFAVPIEDIN